jgi:hypothetical protein
VIQPLDEAIRCRGALALLRTQRRMVASSSPTPHRCCTPARLAVLGDLIDKPSAKASTADHPDFTPAHKAFG